MKIILEEHNIFNLFWFNFYEVDKDVYRSAQITPWRLRKIIKKYNIKTIINLRGNKENFMYKKEKEICEEMRVDYFTISIASRNPHKIKKEELIKLIELLKNSQKPLLFHCKAGADRTGYVAVLYHILNNKDKNWAIKKELKLRYLYFPFSKAGRVKKLFELYDGDDFVKWLEKNQKLLEKEFQKTNFLADFIYDKILRRE